MVGEIAAATVLCWERVGNRKGRVCRIAIVAMALNVRSPRCHDPSGVGGRSDSSDIAKTALMTRQS
jgi:hypothetical protein